MILSDFECCFVLYIVVCELMMFVCVFVVLIVCV